MTVEEIFNNVCNHMIEGVHYHERIASVFNFLGLRGFYKSHVWHSIEEMENYYCLTNYYSMHYYKLLNYEIKIPTLIPDSWQKYTTPEIDSGTKKHTIKELMDKWIQWEIETKRLYESARKQLYDLNEVAAALEIDKYIQDVSDELAQAQDQLIELETINYDLIEIIDWQKPMYKKYTKKLGW